MNYIESLDSVNLKDLFCEIAVFTEKSCRRGCIFRTTKGIITHIVNKLYEDSDTDTVCKINATQKYLSSYETKEIKYIDEINTGAKDGKLKEEAAEITRILRKNTLPGKNGFDGLLEKIRAGCRPRYFSGAESGAIFGDDTAATGEELLYVFLKHAFAKYRVNLPGIVAQRIYNEALTLSYSGKMRFEMMKTSADLGHRYAALEYAEYISKKSIVISTEYLLKALPLEAAYWDIAYNLETFIPDRALWKEISSNSAVKKECKKAFFEYPVVIPDSAVEQDEYSGLDCDTKKAMLLTAFRIYCAVARDDAFPKAYNSIGKLLMLGKVVINEPDSKTLTVKTGIDYLERAISFGNPHAMTNYAIYRLFEAEEKPTADEKKDLVAMLEAAADIRDTSAMIGLADLLCEDCKIERAGKILIGVSKKPHITEWETKYLSETAFRLGVKWFNKGDNENAMTFFDMAQKNGCYDAIVPKARILASGNEMDRENAKNHIEMGMKLFSDDAKAEAKRLLDALNADNGAKR